MSCDTLVQMDAAPDTPAEEPSPFEDLFVAGAAGARATLLRTTYELLCENSMLRRLLGVATSDELYFYCALTAFSRFLRREQAEELRCDHDCFEWFLRSCYPVRPQALVLLAEETLGFRRQPRKVHFFPLRK